MTNINTPNTAALLAFARERQTFNCDFLDCEPGTAPDSLADHIWKLGASIADVELTEGDQPRLRAALADTFATAATYGYYLERFYDAKGARREEAEEAAGWEQQRQERYGD